jgi:hypothetical protein
MKNNNEFKVPFKVPEDYFSKMEDKVMGSFYKHKRKERRNRIIQITSVSFVVIGIVSLFKIMPENSSATLMQKNDMASKILDTQNSNNNSQKNVFTFNDKNLQDNSLKQKDNSKKRRNNSKDKTIRKTEGYSEKELQYLEQYIREDTYELMTNNSK